MSPSVAMMTTSLQGHDYPFVTIEDSDHEIEEVDNYE